MSDGGGQRWGAGAPPGGLLSLFGLHLLSQSESSDINGRFWRQKQKIINQLFFFLSPRLVRIDIAYAGGWSL